jgi:hypothetical protein
LDLDITVQHSYRGDNLLHTVRVKGRIQFHIQSVEDELQSLQNRVFPEKSKTNYQTHRAKFPLHVGLFRHTSFDLIDKIGISTRTAELSIRYMQCRCEAAAIGHARNLQSGRSEAA